MVSKSFTLIELLVVTGIILLLTAIILPNYKFGERQYALQRSAHKLAQDLRRVQEMAMSAKEFPGAPETFKGSYGIQFQTDSSNYILFADLDNDQVYDSGEEVEILELEKKVKISNLSPGSPLIISFIPPNPITTIYPNDSLAQITLKAVGMGISQYTYNYSKTVNGWRTPRAKCDKSSNIRECADSFSASATDPRVVYDQYEHCLFRRCFKMSRKYQKQEIIIAGPQRIIKVNKAGLIYVE